MQGRRRVAEARACSAAGCWRQQRAAPATADGRIWRVLRSAAAGLAPLHIPPHPPSLTQHGREVRGVSQSCMAYALCTADRRAGTTPSFSARASASACSRHCSPSTARRCCTWTATTTTAQTPPASTSRSSGHASARARSRRRTLAGESGARDGRGRAQWNSEWWAPGMAASRRGKCGTALSHSIRMLECVPSIRVMGCVPSQLCWRGRRRPRGQCMGRARSGTGSRIGVLCVSGAAQVVSWQPGLEQLGGRGALPHRYLSFCRRPGFACLRAGLRSARWSQTCCWRLAKQR